MADQEESVDAVIPAEHGGSARSAEDGETGWSRLVGKVFATIACWTDSHSGLTATFRWLGPGLIGLAGLLVGNPWMSIPAFVCGVVLMALAEIGGRIRGKAIEQLHGELSRLSSDLRVERDTAQETQARVAQQETVIEAARRAGFDYATSMLRRIAQTAPDCFDANCRMSLYFVEGSEMKIVARFSQNTEWQPIGNVTSGKAFSWQYGLIGTAMQTGNRQQQTFSDFNGSYADWQRRRCNLITVNDLRMKSKQYDVIPLSNPDTKDVVGVVSLETTVPTGGALEKLGDGLAAADGFNCGVLRDLIRMYDSLQAPQIIEVGESHGHG